MATSGQTIFQLSRDEIINAAYRKLLVVAYDQSANASQLLVGAQALNAVVATFQTHGMQLWARKELALVMVANQRDYTIGMGQTIATPYPLHVSEAELLVPPSTSQVPVNMMVRADFNLLPAGSTGNPVNATYQPFVNYGVFSVWPTPRTGTVVGTTVTITYQTPFQYFIAGVDTADFPQEWTNALIYALAVSLAPENGLPVADRGDLKQDAKYHLDTALSNSGEDGSIYFGKEAAGGR